MQVKWTEIGISTAKTDLGVISRTFSLKNNTFSTFFAINKGWQCVEIVFICSDELMYGTQFHLHITF